MSDRKRAIETLKQLRLDYEEFYEEHNNEVTHAYDMAIASLEVDEAYQLEYEPTTKNDLAVDGVARQDIERYIEGFINEYTPKEELEFINLELDGLKHLPSVTPQESVIDKIRAEIEQVIGEHNLDDYDFCSGLICARRIIDKYKGESEVGDGKV